MSGSEGSEGARKRTEWAGGIVGGRGTEWMGFGECLSEVGESWGQYKEYRDMLRGVPAGNGFHIFKWLGKSKRLMFCDM